MKTWFLVVYLATGSAYVEMPSKQVCEQVAKLNFYLTECQAR